MWIKICGLGSAEAVAAAVAAGVDAIGFVLSASPRQVTAAQAAKLAAPARGKALCIAVTRHARQPLVDEMLRDFSPDGWQTDLSDLGGVRIPRTLPLLPVLRSGSEQLEAPPRRFLFEGPLSGQGAICDWSQAAQLAARCELILAGGLSADNVAAAVEAVRPFGVDVSSGVEDSPGVKSPARIAAFVQAARAAGARFSAHPACPQERPVEAG
ncbi:MAG TPA: hypothetical protein VMB48_14610 [Steroidobacteraceae bacterium]|nr:hypothetical protein [Steroidobacteraceae bacterium]